MSFPAGDEYGRARAGLNFIGADLNAQDAFKNIPSLIVAVVDVAWRDQPGWAGGAARVPPLGNHEITFG